MRYEGELTSRMRQESYGRELIIDNVQYEDAGKYECSGINEEAMVPIRRSFTIRVECMSNSLHVNFLNIAMFYLTLLAWLSMLSELVQLVIRRWQPFIG